MPIKEASFWFGLTVFGTGLFGLMEGGNRMPLAIVFTLIGLIATVYSVIVHYKPEKFPKVPLWVGLLLLTWVAISFDYYDRHHSPETLWAEPSVRVVDQTFRNTTVLLDDRHFVDPVFDHVTLEYDGTGPVQVDNAKFIGTVRIHSKSQAITQMMGIAKGLCGGSMELPSTNVPPN